MSEPRQAGDKVEPLFLERWSPRAFDGSPMPEEDLETLFDAARWAPSAYNFQPWRFVYARRETPAFERLLSPLLAPNQVWAQRASVLIFVISDTLILTRGAGELAAARSHSFDAGAAWALLALQATRLGYAAHGMIGLDFEKAREVLDVPERFRIEAAVAVGRRGDKSALPEALKAREQPSGRNAVATFAFEGVFRP